MAGIVEQNAIDINSIKDALGGGGEANPQSGTMLERQAAQEQAAAQALAAEIQPQQQQEPIV